MLSAFKQISGIGKKRLSTRVIVSNIETLEISVAVMYNKRPVQKAL